MPRDDWAKARSKEIGKRALRSGCYFRALRTPKKKRKRRPKRPQVNQHRDFDNCPKCRSGTLIVEVQTFKDATVHFRLVCGDCGKFVKFASIGEINARGLKS